MKNIFAPIILSLTLLSSSSAANADFSFGIWLTPGYSYPPPVEIYYYSPPYYYRPQIQYNWPGYRYNRYHSVPGHYKHHHKHLYHDGRGWYNPQPYINQNYRYRW